MSPRPGQTSLEVAFHRQRTKHLPTVVLLPPCSILQGGALVTQAPRPHQHKKEAEQPEISFHRPSSAQQITLRQYGHRLQIENRKKIDRKKFPIERRRSGDDASDG